MTSMTWPAALARLLPRLIAELPPEALAPLQAAFGVQRVPSIADCIDRLNAKCAFTGPMAEDNAITLVCVLKPSFGDLPAVRLLTAIVIDNFPRSAGEIESTSSVEAPSEANHALTKGTVRGCERLVSKMCIY